jgi:hypothetical protein
MDAMKDNEKSYSVEEIRERASQVLPGAVSLVAKLASAKVEVEVEEQTTRATFVIHIKNADDPPFGIGINVLPNGELDPPQWPGEAMGGGVGSIFDDSIDTKLASVIVRAMSSANA